MQIDAQQQRVVVEHLLEMRDDPPGVDAVPGEAASQLVVDPASRHRLAGSANHRQGHRIAGALVMAEQELENHRRRELGRASEAAARCVEPGRQNGGGAVEVCPLGRAVARQALRR